MTTTPAYEIAQHLSAKGHGTLNGITGWGIFVSKEPDTEPFPDQTITLYDPPGVGANPRFLLDNPSLQIRLRGLPDDYLTTFIKGVDIKNELLGMPKTVLNGQVFVGVWQVNDFSLLKYDDKDRPILTSNWRMVVEPPAGSPASHRDAL